MHKEPLPLTFLMFFLRHGQWWIILRTCSLLIILSMLNIYFRGIGGCTYASALENYRWGILDNDNVAPAHTLQKSKQGGRRMIMMENKTLYAFMIRHYNWLVFPPSPPSLCLSFCFSRNKFLYDVATSH